MPITDEMISEAKGKAARRAKIDLPNTTKPEVLYSRMGDILAKDWLLEKAKAGYYEDYAKGLKEELDDALDVIKEGRTNQIHYLESLNEDWINAKNTVESLREELAKALWRNDEE